MQELDEVVHDMDDICCEWGVPLNLNFAEDSISPVAILDTNILPLNVKCVFSNSGTHKANVEIFMNTFADTPVTPHHIWSTFHHEMGHIMQWLEMTRQEWQGLALLYSGLFMSVTQEMLDYEIDAWNRAEIMMQASHRPPTPEFYGIMDVCLNSYKFAMKRKNAYRK